MAKITLGKRPETIAHTVTATMPDGSKGQITMQYRYRTRKEFAAFLDETFGPVINAEDDGEQPASVAEATERGIAANADYILKIATGWDLDAPFDQPHVEQLCDELPGIAAAIMATYRQAVSEGRLGN